MRAWLLGACLALASVAHAETPWSVGVSDAQKKQAQTFLDEGNALFLDKRYAEARDRYTAALGVWDHPAIRFNLVRCLIQLEKPVDAYDNLKLALAYGKEPLEEGVYNEALTYEKLLADQIATLEVSCTQAGAKVTLDGEPLATCPGTRARRVKPGTHQVVATKQAFLTRTLDVVVVGGTTERVPLTLEPLTASARIEHRWAEWKPWVVFASGFVVVGAGALVDLSAAAKMDAYDLAIAQACPMGTCAPAQVAMSESIRNSAETRSAIAVGVMIAGAATIATGGVMLYLNRGRTVYPEAVERVAPSVAPVNGGATFSLSGRF